MFSLLDEHYNNIKALDVLNQGLFQLQMGEKETVSEWEVCLLRHLQILMASFLECCPPDHIAELKQDCFYGGLPKQFKAVVAYCKASGNVKMYSDYLRVAQEAEKEETVEPAHGQYQQALHDKLLSSMEPQRQPTSCDPFCTGGTSGEGECQQGGMHQQQIP